MQRRQNKENPERTEDTRLIVRSAYSILPPMVVNVYVAYIVYRIQRVVVIPT